MFAYDRTRILCDVHGSVVVELMGAGGTLWPEESMLLACCKMRCLSMRCARWRVYVEAVFTKFFFGHNFNISGSFGKFRGHFMKNTVSAYCLALKFYR